MAKKVYNADTNKWEEKKDSGSTPASNTRKKMNKAAEAKAPKAKKAKKAVKAKAKEKAPVPVKRSVKDKVRVPSQAVADQAAKGVKLKGKVADLPSKKKKDKKGHGIAMGKYKLK